MNVLFCNFDDGWHNEIIGVTAQKIGADNVVSMSTRDHDLSAYTKSSCWIDSRDFNQKKYTFMEGKDLPPLDTKTLEALRWCEALYYPMLDRSEVESLKTITYQERKKYYENDVRSMLYIVKNHRIDLVIFSTIPHISFDYALYGVCKMMGIPMVIAYFGVTIPHRTTSVFCLNDIFDPMPQLRDFRPAGIPEDQIQLPQRMQHYVDHYGRDQSQIKSFVYASDYSKKAKESKVKKLLKLVHQKLQAGDFTHSVRKKLTQKMTGKKINRYLQKNSATSVEGKYIYFPLHYQPECTSLPMGGIYYDQLLAVRLLSQFLPEDVTLYVKPHPRRNLLSNVEFYEQIKSLRNVKLLSSSVNTYSLIDDALAVVSLTGTAILESLVRGTPVMMFGHYVWQYAPNVFHCVNEEDCREAMQTLCSGYTYDRGAFKEFLCELDKQLVDGALYTVLFQFTSIQKEENVKNITDCIAAHVQKTLKEAASR